MFAGAGFAQISFAGYPGGTGVGGEIGQVSATVVLVSRALGMEGGTALTAGLYPSSDLYPSEVLYPGSYTVGWADGYPQATGVVTLQSSVVAHEEI